MLKSKLCAPATGLKSAVTALEMKFKGGTLKYAILSLVCLTGVTALANKPLDIDVTFQKYTPAKQAWGFLDSTSTLSSAWKHIFLFSMSESSSKVLANLNPSLTYCCTMNDWSSQPGATTTTKEIHASDIECRAYPQGDATVFHEPNSGCRFKEY